MCRKIFSHLTLFDYRTWSLVRIQIYIIDKVDFRQDIAMFKLLTYVERKPVERLFNRWLLKPITDIKFMKRLFPIVYKIVDMQASKKSLKIKIIRNTKKSAWLDLDSILS